MSFWVRGTPSEGCAEHQLMLVFLPLLPLLVHQETQVQLRLGAVTC